MGEVEQRLYAEAEGEYDHAHWLARKILRSGSRQICRDFYRYAGKTYCIVNGRVVEPAVADRLADERRHEGRDPQWHGGS